MLQLFANEDADANLFGMTHVTPDYYPQIIVEGGPLKLVNNGPCMPGGSQTD